MEKGSKITLLGGDLRQCYAAEFLARHFDEVALWGLGNRGYPHPSIKQYDALQDALAESKLCVFPVRVSTDGTNLSCPLDRKTEIELLYLFDIFSSNSTILGGIVSKETENRVANCGCRYINYFEREELQIKNALLTAEGALALGITETPGALLHSRVAVLGYGRIAKFLCEKLSGMGAFVTVFARKSVDRSTAICSGFEAFSFENDFKDRISRGFDIIYNTVPARVIDETLIEFINKNTVYIELASAPGGIDPEMANHYGIKTVRADGLPGKISPKSAGKIIAETIVQILIEEEYIT